MECISVLGKMTARSVLLFLRSLMSEITEFYDMSIQQCHLWHGKLLCLVEEIAIYTSFHLKKKKKMIFQALSHICITYSEVLRNRLLTTVLDLSPDYN